MANYVQYIIANQGAGMSPGKLAAQVAHAAVKGYELTDPVVHKEHSTIVSEWNDTGHTKIVLAARDTEHLLQAERYLKDRGIETCLIIDEGRTEVQPLTATAVGCEIVDKDDPDIKFAFGTFKTYREPKPSPKKWYRTTELQDYSEIGYHDTLIRCYSGFDSQ